ncbi:MAG: 1-deoxy-D-xylulose-5-phosphate synthase [Deltaproteobacteria bacterium]|nr:1-deoxy-D-xylulose-5-phosphate synthase [Deltaproteobacteria bacterium]
MSYKHSNLLQRIDSPRDLKKLSLEELVQLAAEIRAKIIETVSRTGGHLAPNLGVVELTLALHYVFDAPKDKILWDVGHQSYTHKLITGRRDRFHTLRTYGGLSGFPKREESVYDTFNSGHSSTSISAGLGISTAKAIKGEKAKVVAVIGDGSTTAGMAFEALNQAGETEKDLIVVLNDNAMSISRSVGAFSSFLSRKMRGRRFVYVRRELENFLKSIPGVGENILTLFKKSEDSFITFFTPGMLFEALKFQYVGPIQGHRLDHLIAAFQNVHHLGGPVLLHVLTVKGKGYGPAEKDPAYYHGVGCFEIATGSPTKDSDLLPCTYTEVFGETMVDLGKRDSKLFAITAAMPEGTGLSRFEKDFPERFLDVGIAEQHAVTFAAGLATEGFKPVVAIYSTFLQRAFDQIIHDVCLSGLPVIFCIDRGGLVGEDGQTHHGQFDVTYLRSLPNMTVMAPKDENELRHMLYTALRHSGPVAIRYPRARGYGVPIDPEYKVIPIGEPELLRQGKDLIIMAFGTMVFPSLDAAVELEKEGLSVGVVNCRFAKPLVSRLVDYGRAAGKVLVVEENALQGGLGGAILELFSDLGATDLIVRRMGLPDMFIEHGPIPVLREKLGLDREGIIKEARALCLVNRVGIGMIVG